MKKNISVLLICLVCLLSLPVYAESDLEKEISIKTIGDFLEFAEQCRLDSYSNDLLVHLENDLDLSSVQFEGIPIFNGTFDGNGHVIEGLDLHHSGSKVGLFRILKENAVVMDLHLKGTIHPSGSQHSIGAIAGINDGQIINCHFAGSISGSDEIGGIAGVNTVKGIIDNCTNSASVEGNHFAGGISGKNQGVIRNCFNYGPVNITPKQNEVELSEITVETLTNSESVNTVTDLGGIAGNNSGVIRNCHNSADVGYHHMGYNLGGIAGSQTGYIVGCSNTGKIEGRKEIGGIAGHAEPVYLIEYSKDTLQILEDQLNDLSSAVNRTSSHIEDRVTEIGHQVNDLQSQNQIAKESIDILLPDSKGHQIPDSDTLLAAQTTLTSTMSEMPETIQGISSSASQSAYGFSQDMMNISNQISKINKTIQNASEYVGVSLVDASDEDTKQDLSSKIENCKNSGKISAEMNAGGIAGAIAMETDMDAAEDWQMNGETSLYAEGKIRSVVKDSINEGEVISTKLNAGGIIGWQSMGLVQQCSNTGKIGLDQTKYVGGISGLSTGIIRNCINKSEVIGNKLIGGIAGLANRVSDCISVSDVLESLENKGAILGDIQQSDGTESNVTNNIYLSVNEDLGGIDGISFDGMAYQISLEELMNLDEYADILKKCTLTFRFDDGTEKQIIIETGTSLKQESIPSIPKKANTEGKWSGLEFVDLNRIVKDMTFELEYVTNVPVIQSEIINDDGLPVFLAEGKFTEQDRIMIEETEMQLELNQNETLLGVWKINVSGEIHKAHLLLPSGHEDIGNVKLIVQDENGYQKDVEFEIDGRYIDFDMDASIDKIAMVSFVESNDWKVLIAAAVLLFLPAYLIKARHK